MGNQRPHGKLLKCSNTYELWDLIMIIDIIRMQLLLSIYGIPIVYARTFQI